MDEDPRLRVEEPINVLQAPVGGFRIEEEGDGDKAGADDRPDDPEPPLQVRDPARRDLRDHVVANPVRGHGEARAFGSHLERVDFCGVQPWNP